MATLQLPPMLQAAIAASIKDALDQLVEAELRRATAALESGIREQVGNLALRVLSTYRVETGGNELLIRVDLSKLAEPGK